MNLPRTQSDLDFAVALSQRTRTREIPKELAAALALEAAAAVDDEAHARYLEWCGENAARGPSEPSPTSEQVTR